MVWSRRNFLAFLGAGLGTSLLEQRYPFLSPVLAAKSLSKLSFDPIAYPLPLTINALTPAQQKKNFAQFGVSDDLVLPEGFSYNVLAQWGDPVGDAWFGYNNDYLALVETADNRAWLTVNFEYISFIPWSQGYQAARGKSLPLESVQESLQASGGKINAHRLPDNDPLKLQIRTISEAALLDHGIGVLRLQRNAQGEWQRDPATGDRRITGLAGLVGGKVLEVTGPARLVFTNPKKRGYEDQRGITIIGTMQNCAGGTTPWGTVLSAEENFQDQVPEAVYADGSSLEPEARPFQLTAKGLGGLGNVFGLAGNKYGWMVEVDPSNPQDYGRKHSWLGRFRHEAVSVRAEVGKPLAVYSGCDRRSGHLYKFISQEKISQLQDKTNSRLFEAGMLYGAKFNADGTGEWIALKPETAIDPLLPSQMAVENPTDAIVLLPHPDRSQPGALALRQDSEIADYRSRFSTLADLYTGTPEQRQGAILVDAHLAANAVGITATARPEDTALLPNGSLLIAFTSGWPSSQEGGCDQRIFRGPQGEVPYESGWIMQLQEDGDRPDATRFCWKMMATGGEPQAGGLGFANPDNLELDGAGNLWMVTDMSTSKQNKPFERNATTTSNQSLGQFGNNSLWFLPTHGSLAGQAFPFALGPMDSELTGPVFSQDQQTLFLAVQHPGEARGTRQAMASQTENFSLTTTNGETFTQERRIPLGSNWPSGKENQPPRPAVVMIRRRSAGPIP